MSKKFLIGQLARYGDCLFATTIARQIKHDDPDSHVTWAIASAYRSILDLNPYVDTVWEIKITDGDYYLHGWDDFVSEAMRRKAMGDFDRIILSQIYPHNSIRFFRTIRGTILSAYRKTITVPVSPVLQLSADEIKNVKTFALSNDLAKYKHVILFECNPGSNQSTVNYSFALEIAKHITSKDTDTCFILTADHRSDVQSPQIIDAGGLTFRENAELTKYCTLLIGCSSGITWLSTSEWAKKLPMLQLLESGSLNFAGVHFDFEVQHLDTSAIIEMAEYDFGRVCDCILALLHGDFSATKKQYHQQYRPEARHLYTASKDLVYRNYSLFRITRYACAFLTFNRRHHNKIRIKTKHYLDDLIRIGISKDNPEISYGNPLWNSFKHIIKKKLQRKHA